VARRLSLRSTPDSDRGSQTPTLRAISSLATRADPVAGLCRGRTPKDPPGMGVPQSAVPRQAIGASAGSHECPGGAAHAANNSESLMDGPAQSKASAERTWQVGTHPACRSECRRTPRSQLSVQRCWNGTEPLGPSRAYGSPRRVSPAVPGHDRTTRLGGGIRLQYAGATIGSTRVRSRSMPNC
jgi:hypothetical protein